MAIALDLTTDELACPTCNARQAWSDECRRCRCDLSHLRKVWRAAQRMRVECLRCLNANDPRTALRRARRLCELTPSPQALRLLAVCELRNENWPEALAAARWQGS